MPEPTKQERRLAIWRGLTPEQRDYDRFVAGQIPQGASFAPETTWGILQGRARLEAMATYDDKCQGCACHRNPPCGHCEGNHRDHEVDDHEPADGWVLEIAESEAYEEAAARERSEQWRAYAAAHPNTTLIEI